MQCGARVAVVRAAPLVPRSLCVTHGPVQALQVAIPLGVPMKPGEQVPAQEVPTAVLLQDAAHRPFSRAKEGEPWQTAGTRKNGKQAATCSTEVGDARCSILQVRAAGITLAARLQPRGCHL